MKAESPTAFAVSSFNLTQLVGIDARLRRAMLFLKVLTAGLTVTPFLDMIYVSYYDSYMLPEELAAGAFYVGLVLFVVSWPLGSKLRFAERWAAVLAACVVIVLLGFIVVLLSVNEYLPSFLPLYMLVAGFSILAWPVVLGIVATYQVRRLDPIGGKVDALQCLRYETRLPPSSRSPSKLGLAAVYYALPLLAFALIAVLTSTIRFEPTTATFIAAVVALGVGIWSWDRAKLVRRLTAVEARNRDQRPPTVLLRSFADDMLKLKPPLLSAKIVKEDSFEEIIADQLWVRGPVIAIGRPGEAAPPAGAARSYYTDADWQEQAERMVSESKVIAMIVGATRGLEWELRRVLRLNLLRKLLLIFPPVPARESPTRWQTFLSQVGEPSLVEALQGIPAQDLMMVSFVDDVQLAVFLAGERRDPLAYHLALAASMQLLPQEVLSPEHHAESEA